jgi:hypothetical protein
VLPDQPPFMYPRSSWTQGPSSGDEGWEFDDDLYEKLGSPIPTEAFVHYKPTTQGRMERNWKSFCRTLMQFMGQVQRGDLVSSESMEAMLEMAGRGLEGVVCMIPCCLDVGTLAKENDCTNRLVAEKDAMPKAFRRSTKGVAGWGFWSGRADKVWEAIKDHRFISGILHFPDPEHWVAFAFDREAKVFVMWDSFRDGTEKRFLAGCAYWREYLMTLGLPFDFQAVAVPMARQPDGVSCGPISLWQLFVSMRGWVGMRLSDMKPG